MKILVIGGTTFASRYTAEYFTGKGHKVYVLNRGTMPQSAGVEHIKADRYNIGNALKNYDFDAVLAVSLYDEKDTASLISALGKVKHFIFVSSSAVYPETLPQPFCENQPCARNKYWGDYGTNKIAAERLILSAFPQAYIIRPPYLCGKMNNLYREAFVFECAENDRPFYMPKDGSLPLQFFDIEDMCRFMELLISKQPMQRIFNVGNPEAITAKEWTNLCYDVLNKKPRFIYISRDINQREYFPFLDYEYRLNVTEMLKLMPDLKPLERSLRESYEWYRNNRELIRRKPLIEFIDTNL